MSPENMSLCPGWFVEGCYNRVRLYLLLPCMHASMLSLLPLPGIIVQICK